ncbi:MAG: VOC family protein [Chitinophagaceae bacterium]|nr:MAG: VOC family protein [Chitinophagaceae bacterium]
MNINDNCLNWFEIPVEDLQRAKYFYQKIFSVEMSEDTMMGMRMAFFPSEHGNGKVGGALVKSEMHKPNTEGVLVYLNANPDVSVVLEKIEEEGGIILMSKTLLTPEAGYIAMFLDPEGNRIALHSYH